MRGGIGGGIAVVLVLLFGASYASAATEVGNVCTAESAPENVTFVQLENVSSALPIAAPAAGVVTQWKVISALPSPLPQRLKVLRPTGKPGEFASVHESTEQSVVNGTNVFDTRLPVAAGDRFGLFGGKLTGTLFCFGKPGDAMGFTGGNPLVTDAPAVFNPVANDRVAVSAVVEPDVDGDGFGDETQDKCPQSAAFQIECPAIGIEDFAVAGNGAVTVLLTADHEAPVTVTGAVRAGKKSKRKALKGGGLTLSGGTQTVVPGKLAKFKLKFSAKLKSQLRSLPHGKSLTLSVVASAKNAAGQTFTKTTAVKLKG
ncbi:MAG: hypothetical protein ACHQCF_01610 [Solirubrobacterales bacterium]